MSLGFSEILLILVVVLLLFGAKRLPEIARSLGRASSEFKRAKEDFLHEMEQSSEPADKTISADEAPKKEEPVPPAGETDRKDA